MRWKLVTVFVAATVIAVAGCGSDDSNSKDAKKDSKPSKSSKSESEHEGEEGEMESGGAGLEVKLDEQESSGISGDAEFTEKDGATKVEVYLKGADDKGSYASHVHPGTCDKLDPTPKYPLESVTGGRAESTVDATLDDLIERPSKMPEPTISTVPRPPNRRYLHLTWMWSSSNYDALSAYRCVAARRCRRLRCRAGAAASSASAVHAGTLPTQRETLAPRHTRRHPTPSCAE